MAGKLDFTALTEDDLQDNVQYAPRQGTRWYWTATIHNYDAAGVVARMMLKQSFNGDPVLEITEDDGKFSWSSRGSSVTDAVLVCEVSAVIMAALASRTYKYDLELVPSGSEALAYALLFGVVALQPQVTT